MALRCDAFPLRLFFLGREMGATLADLPAAGALVMVGGGSKRDVLHKGLKRQGYSAPTIPTEIFGTVFRKSRLSDEDPRSAAASAALSLSLSLSLSLLLPLPLSLLLPLSLPLLISSAFIKLVSLLSGSPSLLLLSLFDQYCLCCS